MTPYLKKALRQFDNVIPTKRHQSQYPHVKPNYGAKQQFINMTNWILSTMRRRNKFRNLLGNSYGYARGVDGTLLTPLSAIAKKQSKPTVNTMTRSHQIMDCVATQESAVLTYRKIDMVLKVHSNASYLDKEEARSRAGGHHLLSENVPLPPTMTPFTTFPKSSKELCHLHLKPNWVPCILTHAKQLRRK